MHLVTWLLILANAAVFLLQGIWEEPILSRFALWPLGRFALPELHAVVGFHWWQLVTSAFLHANLTHLFLNMFALFMFGRDVEQVLGGRRYLAVYAAAVLSAALVQLFVVSFTVPASDPPYPTVGASGGVFGVLLAFGMLFPRRRVMLVFPPIPMPAWFLVFAYALIELASGVLGEAGIAHFAHLGGMLGAYLMLRVYRRDATSHPEGSND